MCREIDDAWKLHTWCVNPEELDFVSLYFIAHKPLPRSEIHLGVVSANRRGMIVNHFPTTCSATENTAAIVTRSASSSGQTRRRRDQNRPTREAESESWPTKQRTPHTQRARTRTYINESVFRTGGGRCHLLALKYSNHPERPPPPPPLLDVEVEMELELPPFKTKVRRRQSRTPFSSSSLLSTSWEAWRLWTCRRMVKGVLDTLLLWSVLVTW